MKDSQDATVIVGDIVGGEYLVSSLDGGKVFRAIEERLLDGKHVRVEFPAVELLTSAFLNAAIGQLYGRFDRKLIEQRLEIVGLNRDEEQLLQRVIEAAMFYFQNRAEFERAIRESGASYGVGR